MFLFQRSKRRYSRIDSGRGGVYTEKAGENGPFVAHGCELLHLLFER